MHWWCASALIFKCLKYPPKSTWLSSLLASSLRRWEGAYMQRYGVHLQDFHRVLKQRCDNVSKRVVTRMVTGRWQAKTAAVDHLYSLLVEEPLWVTWWQVHVIKKEFMKVFFPFIKCEWAGGGYWMHYKGKMVANFAWRLAWLRAWSSALLQIGCITFVSQRVHILDTDHVLFGTFSSIWIINRKFVSSNFKTMNILSKYSNFMNRTKVIKDIQNISALEYHGKELDRNKTERNVIFFSSQ